MGCRLIVRSGCSGILSIFDWFHSPLFPCIFPDVIYCPNMIGPHDPVCPIEIVRQREIPGFMYFFYLPIMYYSLSFSSVFTESHISARVVLFLFICE
jgi:hypothetical protein